MSPRISKPAPAGLAADASPSGSVRPPAEALVGTLVAGKYRLIRTLGRGGMGCVFKAENVPIGKVVALKLLHDDLIDDAVAMRRFEREARATVAIAHPNIVEVLDMGRDARGAPYLVMEYVRGEDLKHLLHAAGPLPIERAAKIAGQVLRALTAAHGRGVVHRDLKPENVLLTTRHGERDVVKVVDFGISTFVDARAEQERQVDLTPAGLTMATPFYASPEQIRGANGRDPRVDVYAVGVMLYEMLAGHRPFLGENLVALCERILAGEVPPLAVFRRDVPPALEGVIARALAADVGARFQAARDFHEALVPFGAREPDADEAEATDTFTVDVRALSDGDAGTLLSLSREQDETELEVARPMLAVSERLCAELLAHFELRFGAPRVRALLATLEPRVQQGLRGPDAHALGRALGLLDRKLGRNDRTEIGAAGRHFAKQVFAEVEPRLSGMTPALFFSLSGEFWRRWFCVGEPRVSAVGRGYGRLEVHGAARTPLVLGIAMLGALEEGLKLSGGRMVSVRIAATSALGDALDAFEATWSG